MKEIKILYVDDEVNNLSSFRATFRFDYTIITAQSTIEAFDLLQQNPDIAIVLTDQRMPGQYGVEFLEEVKKKFPRPVRMLITGYTDSESIIDAINRGNVFRYIRKPWSDVELIAAIEEGHKYYLTNSLLSKKNEELQQAYKLLNDFAYNVTHGLRDPILSVLSMVEISQHMDNVPEDVREILNMVALAMEQLDNYIENTHDYHTLKSGQSSITNIAFDSFIGYIKAQFENEITSRNIRFVTNLDQKETFRSNEALLLIIVNNLLSNAFKYQKPDTEDKFVALDILVENGSATITVSDNGIGIPENEVKNIFEPLYRATAAEHGSGLGLFNAKDALLQLGGGIYVDSKLNEGSTFKVIIPTKK